MLVCTAEELTAAQSLPPPPPPPLVATTITTIAITSAAAPPTIACVRRLPLSEPRPLKKPAAREEKPGPFGGAGVLGGAGAAAGAEEGGEAGAGGGGAAARRPPRGSGISGSEALGASSLRFWTSRWASAFASGSLCS